MSKELIGKLQPFVSTFSEALKAKFKHGDEVVVGGIITEVFRLNNWLPEGAEDEGVYVKLDDGIGYNHLVIPTEAFDQFVEEYDLDLGSLILAEGRLFTVNTTHSYELQGKTVTVDNHKYETTRVLAWELKPLPDKIEFTEEI
jgi:hypothetical protein